MSEQEPRGPLYDHKSAAYWRGRAERAEAQAITGQPVPVAVADLIHERDELMRKSERLRNVIARALRELDVPAYYGPGSVWDDMLASAYPPGVADE